MSEKQVPHTDWEMDDREYDIAALITTSSLAERMSTIAPLTPSAFCFSSFELTCVKRAVALYGRVMLKQVRGEVPEESEVSREDAPEGAEAKQ